MYAPTNSRRIGQIRASRSGSGGDGDLERRRDDKNSKADDDVDSTVNFVVCLLIAVVLACVGLYWRHSYRVATEASHLTIPNVQVVARATMPHLNINKAAAVVSSAHIHFQEEQYHIVQPQSKSTRTQELSPERLDQPKLQAAASQLSHELSRFSPPLDYVHTEVTWPGCIDTLPDPDRRLDPPAATVTKSTPYDYNRRHIVPPPPGPVTLVCCETTKGTLTIEVHPTWAPNGAARFLDMVSILRMLGCHCFFHSEFQHQRPCVHFTLTGKHWLFLHASGPVPRAEQLSSTVRVAGGPVHTQGIP